MQLNTGYQDLTAIKLIQPKGSINYMHMVKTERFSIIGYSQLCLLRC